LDSSDSRLMKLPSELRNEIYELVQLQPDSSIYIGCTPVDGDNRTLCYRPSGSWEEPGLLRTSKQIRRETMPVYYLCNEIYVVRSCDSINRLRRWLHCLAGQMGGYYPTFTVELRNTALFRGDAYLPLAKLAYDSTSVVADGPKGPLAKARLTLRPDSWGYKPLGQALHDLVELNVQAKARGASYEELETGYRGLGIERGKAIGMASLW